MPPASNILLGFDVGRKKTGIAVGNLLTGGARPLATARGNGEQQLQIIAAHVREWQPGRMIVGLPTRGDGRAHAMTAASRRFAARLGGAFSLPVEFVDERLTSAAARRLNPPDLDAAAAAIILQDWLDAAGRLGADGRLVAAERLVADGRKNGE